jgi:hypothetical protein
MTKGRGGKRRTQKAAKKRAKNTAKRLVIQKTKKIVEKSESQIGENIAAGKSNEYKDPAQIKANYSFKTRINNTIKYLKNHLYNTVTTILAIISIYLAFYYGITSDKRQQEIINLSGNIKEVTDNFTRFQREATDNFTKLQLESSANITKMSTQLDNIEKLLIENYKNYEQSNPSSDDLKLKNSELMTEINYLKSGSLMQTYSSGYNLVSIIKDNINLGPVEGLESYKINWETGKIVNVTTDTISIQIPDITDLSTMVASYGNIIIIHRDNFKPVRVPFDVFHDRFYVQILADTGNTIIFTFGVVLSH